MAPVVTAEHLSKTFYATKREPGLLAMVKSLIKPTRVTIEAVKDISFHVGEGELVGFLGPNGSGKTTTLKMLTGILYPTSGKATVLGYIPWERHPEMQRQIALLMGNKMQLWWDLPAWDSFLVLKEIYEVPEKDFRDRVEELVEALGLQDKLNVQVRRLSLGERMKCELVAALLHSPLVVFLDEPTLGLDILSQKSIREFLKRYNREHATTILLTSHYMQDVAELCERVIVIHHGSLIFDGSLSKLTERVNPSRRLRLRFEAPVSEDLSRFGRVVSMGGSEVILEVPRNATSQVASALLQAYALEDIAIEDVPVEDVIRELFTSASPPAPTSPPSSKSIT
ncbi:MAG: ATP-binding cassette domain-containing protein [Fimbriimonadales bacterium]|nr:ATP-binding cassette domain-containing protein [Fimbriimonadales bacterium]